MTMLCRDVRTEDLEAVAAVAARAGSADTSLGYLRHVRDSGQLVLAEIDGRPVGLVGTTTVQVRGGPARMVTDLFVDESARRRGVAGLLLDEVLEAYPRRITCSSQHPGALAAYARLGMEPQWRLLYLTGTAGGGELPPQPTAWTGDRADLVDFFVSGGAEVWPGAVVSRRHHHASVLRLADPDPVGSMRRVLAGLPAGTEVTACVPETVELAGWLRGEGFTVADFDVCCATQGCELPADLACLHPGLL